MFVYSDPKERSRGPEETVEENYKGAQCTLGFIQGIGGIELMAIHRQIANPSATNYF